MFLFMFLSENFFVCANTLYHCTFVSNTNSILFFLMKYYYSYAPKQILHYFNILSFLDIETAHESSHWRKTLPL